MQNEITLAICAYNAERYIAETLRCITTQSFQQFDLWIVNDSSTDGTVEVAKQVLDGCGREYRIINFELNSGLAAGRAYVEQNAKSKYILFVDADDLPEPTLVEKLYNKISSDSDLMAVGCYLGFIDSNGNRLKGGQYLGSITKEDFYKRSQNAKLIFQASNAIFNREIARRVGGRNTSGFPEGKPRYADLCEDLDLWCRMSDLYSEGKAIVVVPEVLLLYRKHSDSMSLSNINMQLRMKHIKMNLKRRRAGEVELSFMQFMNTITPEQMRRFERDNEVATHLRNGVTLIMKGRIFSGGYYTIKAICMNPRYFWQKVKANSGIFR